MAGDLQAGLAKDGWRGHAAPLLWVTLIALAVAWTGTHQWRPEAPHLRRALPSVVSGDEPHYFLIVNSVLADGDLVLDNNYANTANGGCDAGAKFKGSRLDRHTYMVDYERGLSIKWSAVYIYDRFLPAGNVDEHGVTHARHQDNPHRPGSYLHVPAHPPAFSVACALPLRAMKIAPDKVEPALGLVLVLVALVAVYAIYGAGIAAGLSRFEAVFAVALVALCSPWLAYARSFYTEVTVSLVFVAALWAHLRKLPLAAGALLVLAIWIKPSYALIAGAWFLQHLLQRRFRDAVLLSAIVAMGTAALCAWNWSFARAPDVGGAGVVSFGFDAASLVISLAGLNFGVLLFAPWTLVAPVALAGGVRQPATRDFAISIAGPIACHIVLLASINFSAGWCYGCRYWIPYMPWLALLAALALRMHPPLRYALAALALAGLLFSVPAALQYTDDGAIWNQPPQTALLRMLK